MPNKKIFSHISTAVVFFTTFFALTQISSTPIAAVGDTVHDTMNVDVVAQCTLLTDVSTGATGEGKSYTGNAVVVGAEVDLYSGGMQADNHKFEIFCNAREGYTITAEATDLEPISAATTYTIPFNVASDYFTSGANSNWTVTVTGLDADSSDKIKHPRSAAGYEGIIYQADGIEKISFEMVYSVYVGTDAVSATYDGGATYTLTSLPDPV